MVLGRHGRRARHRLAGHGNGRRRPGRGCRAGFGPCYRRAVRCRPGRLWLHLQPATGCPAGRHRRAAQAISPRQPGRGAATLCCSPRRRTAGDERRPARLVALPAGSRSTAGRSLRGIRHHRPVPACCPALSAEPPRLRPGHCPGRLPAEFSRLYAPGSTEPDRQIPAQASLGLLGLRIVLGAPELHQLGPRGEGQYHADGLVRYAGRPVHAEQRRQAICAAGKPDLQTQQAHGLPPRFPQHNRLDRPELCRQRG